MKRKKLLVIGLLIATISSVSATDQVVKYRAESIHCGGCVNKIKKAVSVVDGVSGFEANLDAKVVSITYDDAKVSPEQIREAIIAAKHTAEDYDPNVAIVRTVSFKANQINCGGCAGKVQKNIGAEAGVLKVSADPSTKVVVVEYDAQKVLSDSIKEDFKKFDYTVTWYWDGDDGVAYSSFQLDNVGDKASELEKALSEVDGVYDVTVNAKTNTVALAYNKETVTEKLLTDSILKSNVKLAATE
jgi:copper ion binding protein